MLPKFVDSMLDAINFGPGPLRDRAVQDLLGVLREIQRSEIPLHHPVLDGPWMSRNLQPFEPREVGPHSQPDPRPYVPQNLQPYDPPNTNPPTGAQCICPRCKKPH
jgi:hypothetical protein